MKSIAALILLGGAWIAGTCLALQQAAVPRAASDPPPANIGAGTPTEAAPHLLSNQWDGTGLKFIGALRQDAPAGTRKVDAYLTNAHIAADADESNIPWAWDARKVEAELARRIPDTVQGPVITLEAVVVILDWETAYDGASIARWLSRGDEFTQAHLAELRYGQVIDYIESLLPNVVLAIYDVPMIRRGSVEWGEGPMRRVAARCDFLTPVMYWKSDAHARVQAKGIALAVSFGRELALEVVPHVGIHEMVGPYYRRFGLTRGEDGVSDFERRQLAAAWRVGVRRWLLWAGEHRFGDRDPHVLPYIAAIVEFDGT